MNIMGASRAVLLLGAAFAFSGVAVAQEGSAEAKPAPPALSRNLQLSDLFDLENVSDPQISPDGSAIVFVRNGTDMMKDRKRSSLWMVTADGGEIRPLVSGAASPRWAPDGKRLLYTSAGQPDGPTQVFVRWMDGGESVQVTTVQKAPAHMTWSPDGKWIAFTMLVPEEAKPFAQLPKKPEGADWGKPVKMIENLQFRTDSQGFLPEGFTHVFVVPAEGGTPRQLTRGAFHHRGPLTWDKEGGSILFSSLLRADWQYEPLDSEIYEVTLAGELRQLTKRAGPDAEPEISPDGKLIAYIGFDDRRQGYQVSRLYVMRRDGSDPKLISGELDRDVEQPRWKQDGSGLYFMFDDQGTTKIGFIDLNGKLRVISEGVGGVSFGRPYGSGSFSVSKNDLIAFTRTSPYHPADLAIVQGQGGNEKRLTALNDDVLKFKTLGKVEEIRYRSSLDEREIHGWIVKPPGFDRSRKYPLILEIHGGPFANYGDRFTSEIQLYAAAGYVVLYTNPRGSTSYGEEFGNLIHHSYPGGDYDDLLTGVEVAAQRGYVDRENLFVTGGSGGGVLTAWIIGKTNLFKAAVVAKPVVNWFSFVLTSDIAAYATRYWFPGLPWEHPEEFARRSPISLVGNVETPTMLITGEVDYRTPMSESEQYFTALKLRKIDSALVRLPDTSHDMEARTSHLIAKVAYTLRWFDKYRTGSKDAVTAK
jgi:dipeptidyl aminopeptidase/acylaminoacyl peptidase